MSEANFSMFDGKNFTTASANDQDSSSKNRGFLNFFSSGKKNGVKLADSLAEIKNLEDLLKAKDEELQLAKQQLDQKTIENLEAKLQEKLSGETQKFNKQIEGLKNSVETLTEEMKALANDFRAQTIEDAVKIKALEDKLDERQREMEQFHTDNFSVKENVDKLRSAMAAKEDLLTVSKYVLDHVKDGHVSEFVLKNVSGTRIAYDIYPYRWFSELSPRRGVLEVGEKRKITLLGKREFDTYRVRVFSVKVPEGGGTDFQQEWFEDEPWKVKTNDVMCVYE